MELVIVLLFVLLAFHQFGFIIDNKSISVYSIISLILNLAIAWLLTFIFIYDLKYQEVLDSMTLVPALIIFVVKILVFGASWQDMLIGAGIGAGFFLLQYIISKGKWVGGGDIRIGLLMGIILGWKLVLLALWIAYIVGAIISVVLLFKKKKQMSSQIAFGTFLSMATLVVMMWGESVLAWYLAFLN
jgi:prepilin signal peptidase PulO-like enzyme (type II secretory pathway)